LSTPNQATKAYLTLGWQVTATLDPRYWLDSTATPGDQSLEELARVEASTMATHTAIIAQSGSGKSFFLGRLVEELMLETKARCVIFDPNADFRKVRQVEHADLWKRAEYQTVQRRGRLPHEKSQGEFMTRWSQIPIRVRTGASVSGNDYEKLQLWWPSLDMAFFAEDIEPMLRSDLYHCHAFVRTLATLLDYKYIATDKTTDLVDAAQRIFRQARGLSGSDLREALIQEYNSNQLFGVRSLKTDSPTRAYSGEWLLLGKNRLVARTYLQSQLDRFIEGALTLAEYVSPEVERFYFGKAREYETSGILQIEAKADPWTRVRSSRLEVIDLPSLPDRGTRLLAINALLTTEWEQAKNAWAHALELPPEDDNRIPTFIVVDEAHNLIPKETTNKSELALREQFRTLVAEGRKYGLFLILVSQRPDKLDPLVLSECENRALMKIGSGSVLSIARQMLGLDDLSPRFLEKSLEFETGRVMLIGRWSPEGPQIIYAAARRTIEGGRNLRPEQWANPKAADYEGGLLIPSSKVAKPTRSSKRSRPGSKKLTKKK
jgi:hypothetical protein